MRDVVDMSEVVKNVKAYAPPKPGMGEPIGIEASPELVYTLGNLMHEIYERDYKPEKCAFYMHPNVYNEYVQLERNYHFPAGGFQGRPIRIHHTMPEDTVLFMAPDAVGLGGEVYHPGMIAYTVIG